MAKPLWIGPWGTVSDYCGLQSRNCLLLPNKMGGLVGAIQHLQAKEEKLEDTRNHWPMDFDIQQGSFCVAHSSSFGVPMPPSVPGVTSGPRLHFQDTHHMLEAEEIHSWLPPGEFCTAIAPFSSLFPFQVTCQCLGNIRSLQLRGSPVDLMEIHSVRLCSSEFST